MVGVQYGKDLNLLKDLVKELYPDASTRPKVLGPAGFYEENWCNTFLETIEPEVVDGVTHHLYNLGSDISIYVSKLRSMANNSFK